jgi:hypothetical protein
MLFFPDASKRHENIPKACTRCLFAALVLPYNMASNTLSNHDRIKREVVAPESSIMTFVPFVNANNARAILTTIIKCDHNLYDRSGEE